MKFHLLNHLILLKNIEIKDGYPVVRSLLDGRSGVISRVGSSSRWNNAMHWLLLIHVMTKAAATGCIALRKN